MDITLIAIAIFILVAIVFLTLFLFNSINKKSFTAEDGSVFDSQSDLDTYQKLFDKLNPLFSPEDEKGSAQENLGFDKLFLSTKFLKSDIDMSKLFSASILLETASATANLVLSSAAFFSLSSF